MESNKTECETKPTLTTKPLLTTKRLLTVFFVQLNEAYQLSVLLPIVVFMCRDFGISSKWLGVYSSLLNASFSFCQFFVCYFWGKMSDVYGRRNILICGLCGTSFAMIIFGFSTSFEMAMICRCLTGVFNGNLAVLKAYLADITDSSNRGYAFTMIGVSYGAGIIFGSMLGGVLIDTNDVDAPDHLYIKTQSILKWSIFEHFPYVLPIAVCGGIISVNALLWAILYIKDIHRIQRTSMYDEDIMDIASDIEMTSNLTAPISMKYTPMHIDSKEEQCHTLGYYPPESYYTPMHQSLPSHHEIKAMLSTFKPDKLQLLTHIGGFKSMDKLNTISDLFKYTKLCHGLLQYGTLIISWYMFKEMGPVFMAQSLYFDSAYIGYTQACSGIIYFIFSLVFVPILLKKFQHHVLCAICMFLTMITCILMPSTYWFTFVNDEKFDFMKDKVWLLCMVFFVEILFTVGVSMGFTVTTCWVNNSVPMTQIGRANGIAQTLAAFVRGFGPILTGFIWSESVTQMEDGLDYAVYFAYLPAALLLLVAIIDIVAYIPSYLQLAFEEQHDVNNQKT